MKTLLIITIILLSVLLTVGITEAAMSIVPARAVAWAVFGALCASAGAIALIAKVLSK